MPKIRTINNFGLTEGQIEYIKKCHEDRVKEYNDDFLKIIAGTKEYEIDRLKKEIERRRNTSIFERWSMVPQNIAKW